MSLAQSLTRTVTGHYCTCLPWQHFLQAQAGSTSSRLLPSAPSNQFAVAASRLLLASCLLAEMLLWDTAGSPALASALLLTTVCTTLSLECLLRSRFQNLHLFEQFHSFSCGLESLNGHWVLWTNGSFLPYVPSYDCFIAEST